MNVREFVTRLAYQVNNRGRLQYERGIDRIKRVTENFGTSARGVHLQVSVVAAAAAKKAQAAWAATYDKMKQQQQRFHADATKSASGTANAYSGLISRVRDLAAAYLSVKAASAFMNNLQDAGGKYEQYIAGLTTAYNGDEEKAKSRYRMLGDFAAVTPYQTDELTGGFTDILGGGVELTKEQLTALGDLSSGSRKSFRELIETIKSANRGQAAMVDNFIGLKAKAEDGQLAMEMFDQKTKKWTKTMVEAGNMKGIIDFFVQAGQRENVMGAMDRQSETLPGKISTIKDNVARLYEYIWLSGIDKYFHNAADSLLAYVQRLQELAKEHVPRLVERFKEFVQQARDLAAKYGPLVLDFFKAARDVLPYVIAYFVAMKAHALGLKIIFAGAWLLNAIKTVRGLTMATMAANAAAFAIPIAITAAFAALAYLGYQVYRYVTQGEKGIEGLRKRLPWLADSVVMLGERWKTIQPYVMTLVKTAWSLIKTIGSYLAPIAKWAFENVMVPAIISVIQMFTGWIDWIKTAVEFWMPKITQGFADWKRGAGIVFDFLAEKFEWLMGWLGKIGDGYSDAFNKVKSFFGLGGSSGGGTSPLDDPNFPLNNTVANQLVRNAYKVYTGANKCFKGVARAYINTFGDAGKLSGMSAYMAADQLAADKKRFREVAVTPEMLNDPAMRKALNGAVVVYNRQSGFSTEHGHIEVWDTERGKALYGNGVANLNRSQRNLANARAFIPIGPADRQPVNMASGGRGGASSTTINLGGIHQNIGANVASPAQVGNAAANGANSALSKAARTSPRPIS